MNNVNKNKNNKEKISYTAFLLLLNILFILTMISVIFSQFFLTSGIFDLDFYFTGITLMSISLIIGSVSYYICWKKDYDHHKVVFWSFIALVGFSVSYFVFNTMVSIKIKYEPFWSYFIIQGILLSLLIYVAEIEHSKKEEI